MKYFNFAIVASFFCLWLDSLLSNDAQIIVGFILILTFGILHGAMPAKMREDRNWQLIEVFEECPLFERLPNEIELMEDHCEAVSIPKDFIHVAVSDATVNEGMMHQSKPFYGVQFHPEVSGNHGALILENFVHICEKHPKETSE